MGWKKTEFHRLQTILREHSLVHDGNKIPLEKLSPNHSYRTALSSCQEIHHLGKLYKKQILYKYIRTECV